MSAVRLAFKPEFLNRLDEIVIFDPLDKEELGQIVDLQLESMSRRLRARRITLEITDEARRWLTNNGYDPAYGARPLRRLVQKEIGDRLAVLILANEVEDGQEVLVSVADGGNELRVEPVVAS